MVARTGPHAGKVECSSTHVPPFRNVNCFPRINNHCQLSFILTDQPTIVVKRCGPKVEGKRTEPVLGRKETSEHGESEQARAQRNQEVAPTKSRQV